MSSNKPENTGQADQQYCAAIRKEDDVDEVLREAEAQNRQEERKGNDTDNHCALLPRFAEKVCIELTTKLLDERNHYIAGGNHHQHSGPPGTETREESQERSKSFVCPHVNGAFSGKH